MISSHYSEPHGLPSYSLSSKISFTFYLLLTIATLLRYGHATDYPLIRNPNVQIGSIIHPTQKIDLRLGYSQSISYTIPFTPAFDSIPPYILLAMIYQDNQSNIKPNENFRIEITSITTDNFTILASKNGIVSIYRIAYKYIAIARSSDVFVDQNQLDYAAHFNATLSSPGITVLSKYIPYHRALNQSTLESRKITAYYTGYEKSLDTTYAKTSRLYIHIYSEMLEEGFMLHVVSKDPNDHVNQMKTVYYNYIEFYEQQNGYFSMNQYKQNTYLDAFPSDQIKPDGSTLISVAPYSVNIDSIEGIFYGLTNIGYKQGNLISRVRLQSPQFTLNSPTSTSTFSYQIYSWYQTIINSIGTETITFTRLNCDSQSHVFFDQGKQCLPSCPTGYFKVERSSNYFSCEACHLSCATCSGVNSTQCLSCVDSFYQLGNECFPEQPNFTGCDKNLSQFVCSKCESSLLNCQKCSYIYTSNCIECKSGFVVLQSDNKCYCQNPMDYKNQQNECVKKEEPISEETKEGIKQGLGRISEGSFWLTIFLLVPQAFTHGSALLSSAFSNQKLFYILLVNTDIPGYLVEFLHTITNQGVIKKFAKLNWISSNDNLNYNIGNKFDVEFLPSDIINNSGGAIFLLLLIIISYGIILVSLRSRYYQRILSIYEANVSSIFVETTEIIVLVLQFSSAMAMTSFMNLSGVDFALNLVILILSQLFVMLFFTVSTGLIFKYNDSEKQQKILFESIVKMEKQKTLGSITVEKLINNCIQEFKSAKGFMIIYLSIECVVFPISIVAARSDWVAGAVMLILIQSLEFLITFVIKPFKKKRETNQYLIEQSLILISFIIIVSIMASFKNTERNAAEYATDVNIMAFIFIGLVIIVILIPVVGQIYSLAGAIKDYCTKRKKNSSKQNNQILEMEAISPPVGSKDVLDCQQGNPFNNNSRFQNQICDLDQSSIYNSVKYSSNSIRFAKQQTS